MDIKIESRDEYELYAKKQLGKTKIHLQSRKAILELIMHGFDSGIKMTQKSLVVKVFD